jgi:hypothetical protein
MIALPVLFVSEDDEMLKAGAAIATVNVNVCVALPEELVAVIV